MRHLYKEKKNPPTQWAPVTHDKLSDVVFVSPAETELSLWLVWNPAVFRQKWHTLFPFSSRMSSPLQQHLHVSARLLHPDGRAQVHSGTWSFAWTVCIRVRKHVGAKNKDDHMIWHFIVCAILYFFCHSQITVCNERAVMKAVRGENKNCSSLLPLKASLEMPEFFFLTMWK